MIQRQRADIREYLDEDTPFPDRETTETAYKLTAGYRATVRRRDGLRPRTGRRPQAQRRAATRPVVVGDRAAALPGLQPGRSRTDPAQPFGGRRRRRRE